MKLDTHDTKYELFVDRATEALVALHADQNPVKAAQIWEWVEKNHPDVLEILRPSWGSHLSQAINDTGTRIRRQPGRYTYILLAASPDEEAPVGAVDVQPALKQLVPSPAPSETGSQAEYGQPETEQVPYTRREAALYPVLRDWLVARQFRAKDTSGSKSGGAWGNPDVSGIRIAEGFLGRRDLELATIEAKVSLSQWRYWIFEAISHKRFAHRAYFAFAFGSDEPGLDRLPDVDGLRKYAERYRVGILVVFMTKESFTRLVSDKTDDLKLDTAEVRVEELWPALRDEVPAEELTDYLYRVLRLQTDEDLYGFGRE